MRLFGDAGGTVLCCGLDWSSRTFVDLLTSDCEGPERAKGHFKGGAPCAVRKVGRFPPPVAMGPKVLNSAPHSPYWYTG